MAIKIPVLMYHALEDAKQPAGAKDLGEQLYVLQVKQFREQMECLHKEGFQAFFLDELALLAKWPKKAVVLTFDDGHESNYTLALPILKEFGFKGEFFITTGWIGNNFFLKPNQIVALHQSGMKIGSHGVTHKFFDDLSADELNQELRESRICLEKMIHAPVTSLSLPGGRLNKINIKIAINNGYTSLFTSSSRVFNKKQSIFSIPRFTIKNDININNFKSIIHLEKLFLIKIRLKTEILYLLKRILGNKAYEGIREILLPNL